MPSFGPMPPRKTIVARMKTLADAPVLGDLVIYRAPPADWVMIQKAIQKEYHSHAEYVASLVAPICTCTRPLLVHMIVRPHSVNTLTGT